MAIHTTRFTRLCLAFIFSLAAIAGETTAEAGQLRLPNVLGDHMVLQADQPVAVWGWATPNEQVSVEFVDQTRHTRVDEQGRWRLDLAPLEASSDGRTLKVSSGDERVELTDVLVGEVWLCSGQSNMDFPLRRFPYGTDTAAAADDPQLRLLAVPQRGAFEPADDQPGRWAAIEPDSAGELSAFAYFFGSYLREQLDVPVGLIDASWGGSQIDWWVDPARFADDDAMLGPVRQRYEDQVRSAWYAKRDAAESPDAIDPVTHVWSEARRPGMIYRGMICPIAPYTLAGIAWYQGESNGLRAVQYEALLNALVNQWRDAFEQPLLPVGIIQLPSYRYPDQHERPDRSWPRLRESQMNVADADPHAGLVVTIDVGEADDIHPVDKQTPAHRLGDWALHTVYGQADVPYQSPRLADFRIDGKRITLTFDHVGDGLAFTHGQRPRGFAVGNASGRWKWASTSILEAADTIVLTTTIKDPAYVRYGWHTDALYVNLVNSDGLPLAPFRTDRLLDPTEDAR